MGKWEPGKVLELARGRVRFSEDGEDQGRASRKAVGPRSRVTATWWPRGSQGDRLG